VIDENGGPELIEYIVDQNEFMVETNVTHIVYLRGVVRYESSRTGLMLIEEPNEKDISMKEANLKRDYTLYAL
ncbi:hypothetical protein BX666DRAFT_1840009, partial [Dichotomocladium elegans]